MKSEIMDLFINIIIMYNKLTQHKSSYLNYYLGKQLNTLHLFYLVSSS